MHKLALGTILLIILDIALCFYLKDIVLSKRTFEFSNDNKPLIYQKKDIVLNDIDDFIFEDYFDLLSFNDSSYSYKFTDSDVAIILKANNVQLQYPYSLIEAQIIEKEVIKYETIYLENSSNNNQNTDESSDYIEIQDSKIHYSQDHYSFNRGTDISTIISTISSDISCYDNVVVDYANLNPYETGTYDVYFYSSGDSVTKTIVII